MATVSTNYSSTSDSTDIPITLASLVTSSSLTAGRQSTVVTNVSNKYLDCLVTGRVTTGTTPTTAKTIAVYIYVPLKVATSTFSYPIAGGTTLGESDAAATFDADQRSGGLVFAQAASINATSDRVYTFSFSVANQVGYMPLKWGLFVTHDTAVNLNSTAGNHYFHYVGLKADVA